MKISLQLLLWLVLISPVIVKCQQMTQPDSLLDKMAGKWVLTGTIAGQSIIHDIEGKRVLNGQYLQLNEVSRRMEKSGNPDYEATVYLCWQEAKEEYFCLWLDNTSNEGISNQVIGRAKQNENKIELLFKFNDRTLFHTSFLYDRNRDTWEWIMDDEENGKLQPFARVKMAK